MPTCKCGRELDDARGAYGHVKHTGGEREGVDHGPKGEAPDDWRSFYDDLDEPDEPEPDDADDDDGDEPDPSSSSSSTSSTDDGPGLGERLKLAATDDVRHLWGGA